MCQLAPTLRSAVDVQVPESPLGCWTWHIGPISTRCVDFARNVPRLGLLGPIFDLVFVDLAKQSLIMKGREYQHMQSG